MDIDSAYAKLSQRCGSLERFVRRHEKRLAQIVPHETEQFLTAIRQDTEELHKRLQLMILKMAVLTEVPRICKPQMRAAIFNAIRECLDFEDSWWIKRENWTMAEWLQGLAVKEAA